MADPKRILRPQSIRREVEGSLRRLGVDRIDLYQFHWPDEIGTPIEDSWGEMARLVEEGKVRAAGVSNFDVELLERCEVCGMSILSNRLSRSSGARPPRRRSHGARRTEWESSSGMLTDRFGEERVAHLAPDDWRRRSAEFQAPNLARNLALRDALKPIAERHESSVAAIAVAWTLAWPGVAGAIVGAHSPEQVDGWIGAASLELTRDDLDEIAAAIARGGGEAGRRIPRHAPDSRGQRRRSDMG